MSEESNANNYWLQVPEELKFMCLVEARGYRYCVRSILRYLIDRMDDVDRAMSGVTAYDYLIWVDRAFESSLYPIEFHEKDWEENRDLIGCVLDRAQTLLDRIAPADYRSSHRTEYDDTQSVNIVELAQHLDVYCCTFYVFSGQREELDTKLDILLSDSIRNVSYLLTLEDAQELLDADSLGNEFHYISMDAWEPLNWLCRESMPNALGTEHCADAYEKYALFLQNLKVYPWQENTLLRLRYTAEGILKNLCDRIIDEYEDGLNGEVESEIKESDAEKYYEMLRQSSDRNARILTRESEEETEGGISFHTRYADFTQKLRLLMSEYPSTPVVISGLDNNDCEVGYVHDSKTGEFREKVISVFSKSGNSDNPGDKDIVPEELPF